MLCVWLCVNRISSSLFLFCIFLNYLIGVKGNITRLKVFQFLFSAFALWRKCKSGDAFVLQVRVVQLSIKLVVQVLGRVLPLFRIELGLLFQGLRSSTGQHVFSVLLLIGLSYPLVLFHGRRKTNKSRTHLDEIGRLVFLVEKFARSITLATMSQLFFMVDIYGRTIMTVEVTLYFLFLEQVNANLWHLLPFLNCLNARWVFFVSCS